MAQPVLALRKNASWRLVEAPLSWMLHVEPPSAVFTMVPRAPTSQPLLSSVKVTSSSVWLRPEIADLSPDSVWLAIAGPAVPTAERLYGALIILGFLEVLAGLVLPADFLVRPVSGRRKRVWRGELGNRGNGWDGG
jgi:hypothetical protein